MLQSISMKGPTSGCLSTQNHKVCLRHRCQHEMAMWLLLVIPLNIFLSLIKSPAASTYIGYAFIMRLPAARSIATPDKGCMRQPLQRHRRWQCCSLTAPLGGPQHLGRALQPCPVAAEIGPTAAPAIQYQPGGTHVAGECGKQDSETLNINHVRLSPFFKRLHSPIQ